MSEPPQSVASEHESAADSVLAPVVQQPAVATPRRLALEDPSDAASKSSSGSSSSSSADSEDEDAALHKPQRRRSKRSDDAELREAIRLSLMEDVDRAPAAIRP